MFLSEKERDRVQAGEGQRERETQNPKQAPGSELSAQSPMRVSNSRTMRSWPELKSDTYRLSHPGAPIFPNSLSSVIPWLPKTPCYFPPNHISSQIAYEKSRFILNFSNLKPLIKFTVKSCGFYLLNPSPIMTSSFLYYYFICITRITIWNTLPWTGKRQSWIYRRQLHHLDEIHFFCPIPQDSAQS